MMRPLDMKRNGEKGVTVLIVAAFIIPILVLIFAAILDLSRIPIAKRRLKEVIRDASENAEVKLAEYTNGKYGLDNVYSIPAFNFGAEGRYLGDHFDSTRISRMVDLEEKPDGYFEDNIAALYAKAACEIASEEIKKARKIPLLFTSDEEIIFAFQYAVVSIKDTTKNKVDGYIATVGKTSECGSTDEAWKEFYENNGEYDVTDLAELFAAKFGAQAKDTERLGTGLWRVVGSDNLDADTGGLSTGDAHDFDSYWLMSVSYLKVKHMFKEDPIDIMETATKPYKATVGIEAPWMLKGNPDRL